MSYDMAFKGELLYPSSQVAKRALAQLRAYACLDDSVVGLDDVVLAGDRVRVECFTSAYELMGSKEPVSKLDLDDRRANSSPENVKCIIAAKASDEVAKCYSNR